MSALMNKQLLMATGILNFEQNFEGAWPKTLFKPIIQLRQLTFGNNFLCINYQCSKYETDITVKIGSSTAFQTIQKIVRKKWINLIAASTTCILELLSHTPFELHSSDSLPASSRRLSQMPLFEDSSVLSRLIAAGCCWHPTPHCWFSIISGIGTCLQLFSVSAAQFLSTLHTNKDRRDRIILLSTVISWSPMDDDLLVHFFFVGAVGVT